MEDLKNGCAGDSCAGCKSECENSHKKVMDNRLATIEGHIKAVRKMALGDYKCEEILSQVAAIQRALKVAGVEMLKSHLGDYIRSNVAGDGGAGEEAVRELNRMLGSFLWLE